MTDKTDDDFEDFDASEEYPTLMLVARFADLLQKTDWFHHIGEGLTQNTIETSRNYLEALGFPESYPAEVVDVQGYTTRIALLNPEYNVTVDDENFTFDDPRPQRNRGPRR